MRSSASYCSKRCGGGRSENTYRLQSCSPVVPSGAAWLGSSTGGNIGVVRRFTVGHGDGEASEDYRGSERQFANEERRQKTKRWCLG